MSERNLRHRQINCKKNYLKNVFPEHSTKQEKGAEKRLKGGKHLSLESNPHQKNLNNTHNLSCNENKGLDELAGNWGLCESQGGKVFCP